MATFKDHLLPAVVVLSSSLVVAGYADLEQEHPVLVAIGGSAIVIAAVALCLNARNDCLQKITKDDDEEDGGRTTATGKSGDSPAPPTKQTLEGIGEFEPSNVDELSAWAEGGDGPVQFAVGTYYRYGLHPFDRNPVLAYKWYTLGMTSGYEQARPIAMTSPCR